jgi:phosphoserine phosphatase
MPSTCALVLTSSPKAPALSDFAVGRALSMISESHRLDQKWLAPKEAWEALFVAPDDLDLVDLRRRIATSLHGITLDVNIVPGEIGTRRKKLLVADMDSTIINQECIDEIADVVGLKPKIAAITERAMRGELKFEDALTERLGLLAGLTEQQLAEVYETRITLMPGAVTLVATMRKYGAYACLVSGGFTFFTSKIRAKVGFDVDHSNTLGMRDGRMTGAVDGPILGREAKFAYLQRYAQERELADTQTMAVGDGANDLAMIKAAGLGVAYRAKPIVAAEALASITHGDLTALLYLQGYKREEFVG